MKSSPVAGIPFRDTLPLPRNLNRRDSAQRSSLVSVDLTADETPATGSRRRFARRSHIFPHRNTRTGCRLVGEDCCRGHRKTNRFHLPGRAARADVPIRSALGRRRHLATGEPKAKTELSTAASGRQARAVLRSGIPATGLPKHLKRYVVLQLVRTYAIIRQTSANYKEAVSHASSL